MTRRLDLTGQRFNYWTVLERAPSRLGGGTVWLCQCDCGTIKEVWTSLLRTGHGKSCGCRKGELLAAAKRIDRTGQTFGHWTVLAPLPYQMVGGTNKAFGICRCECGTIREMCIASLVSGRSKSCGCYKTEVLRARRLDDRCRHGHERTPENTYISPAGARCCRICRDPRVSDYGRAWRMANPPTPEQKESRARRQREWNAANREELSRRAARYRATWSEDSRDYDTQKNKEYLQKLYAMFPPTQTRPFSPEEDVIIQMEGIPILGICARLRDQGAPRGYLQVSQRRLKLRRGHEFRGVPRGERHVKAKLTEEDVREIRASDLPSSELGVIYGVAKSTIKNVRIRRTWAHVE